MTKYHLYFDDTGSRYPDRIQNIRHDGLNCFGLGGILIKESDIPYLLNAHKEFCIKWGVDYPLHSNPIRGKRDNFTWLNKQEKFDEFIQSLEEFILSLPIVIIGCLISRAGYVERYKETYQKNIWLMCKTAFCIIVERSAKFTDERDGKMEVYFEQTGKMEDQAIIGYLKELKKSGSFFGDESSEKYVPFKAEDYSRVILGDAQRKTKNTPMIQIADLILYPLAKSTVDKNYTPYIALRNAGKLIDANFTDADLPFRGIKYSCYK